MAVLLTFRNGVLIICALAIAYIFFRLSIYTHPSEADDFCFALQFREWGTWSALVYNYLNWSGGYTSTFVSGVVGANPNFLAIYKFLPMSLLLGTIGSAAFFFSALFRTHLSNPWVWLGGLGYTLLYISLMPSVASGFYWFNGAVTYQLANILLMLLLTQCVRIIEQGRQGEVSRSSFAVLAILIVLGIGCTETVMAEIVMLVCSICVWRIIVDPRNRDNWIFIFIVTIIFFLIYALAPGNTQRAATIIEVKAHEHAGYDFLDAYKSSVYFGYQELIRLLSSIQLWCATILYVLFFRSYADQRIDLRNEIRPSHILLSALVCLLLPLALQFPSQLMISTIPPNRTQNSIYFGFLLSWFCLWTLLAIKYKGLSYFDSPTSKSNFFVSLAASVVMIYCIATSYNIDTAYNDLTTKAQSYDEALNKRYADITAAINRGDKKHTVKLLKDPPSTINVISMIFNKSTTNHVTCFSHYYRFGPLDYQ